jgi:hypothetical protein
MFLKTDTFSVETNYNVAKQFEYVSNYFDNQESISNAEDETMTLELPALIEDKTIMELVIKFAIQNATNTPVPKFSLEDPKSVSMEKVRDCFKIQPINAAASSSSTTSSSSSTSGIGYNISTIFKKLDVPEWCVEFFTRELTIPQIFEVTRYSDFLGFHDLTNLCIFQITSLYMTRVMNKVTMPIFERSFTMEESKFLRKKFFEEF